MAYQIPRNVKGEGRILFIFSTKALITTGIGAVFGGMFWWIFKTIGLGTIGVIFLLVFALIGFGIRNFKSTKYNSF